MEKMDTLSITNWRRNFISHNFHIPRPVDIKIERLSRVLSNNKSSNGTIYVLASETRLWCKNQRPQYVRCRCSLACRYL